MLPSFCVALANRTATHTNQKMKRFSFFIFLAVLVASVRNVNTMFMETGSFNEETFQFGVLYLNNSIDIEKNINSILYFNRFCFEDWSVLENYIFQLRGKYGTTLLERSGTRGSSVYSEEEIAISSKLNLCNIAFHKNKYHNEAILQLSLFIWPYNYVSSKNYAYMLEYSGAYHASKSLFSACFSLTGDIGCLIHSLVVTPILQVSEEQLDVVYIELLRDFFQLLKRKDLPFLHSDTFHQDNAALSILRALPFNSQYVGYSPSRVFELLSLALVKYYPQLEDVFTSNPSSSRLLSLSVGSPSSTTSGETAAKTIRLGIVSGKFLCGVFCYSLPLLYPLVSDVCW
jgi:hypothetical protein